MAKAKPRKCKSCKGTGINALNMSAILPVMFGKNDNKVYPCGACNGNGYRKN